MQEIAVNWLALIVAVIARMVLGAVWFSPLLFVKSDHATDGQSAGRMGAGGTETLGFTAKSPGKVELRPGYACPWEKDAARAKAFSVTIVVR